MAPLSDLKDNPLFKALSKEEIDSVIPIFTEKRMSAGGTVFVENMPGESLYLVRQGTIKISKMVAEGQEKILVVLGADDIFGDLAIFDGAIRATTARVAEDAVLLKVTRESFDRFCRDNPALGIKIMRNIIMEFCRRLRETEQETKKILSHLLEVVD